jgi:undecaprenyl-diphosphatase
MFTSASYLTVFFPVGKIVFFTVASVIGMTRMHVGVHYPSDVLVGALMGLLWGYLFSHLAKLLIKKINERSPKSKKT